MKEPSITQEKKARQWMLKERAVRAAIVTGLEEANELLMDAGTKGRDVGGMIDPFDSDGDALPSLGDVPRIEWKARRMEDRAAADAAEKWFPDWGDVDTITGNAGNQDISKRDFEGDE